MTFSMIGATVIVLLTIAALLKRWETRLVLITAGLAMGIISLAPNIALGNMMKNMTNASMILAICSSLGFAAVVSMTRCDVHFVGLLVKPLGKLGFFLLPFCMLVASCVAIAIPSAAGCAAALGPTMIPLMVRAGFRPAIAGAAIIGSIIPSALSPGSSHNVWVAKISNMEVMDLIVQFAPKILVLCALNIIMVTAMIFVFRDYKKNAGNQGDVFEVASDARGELPEHVNFFYAIAPILPIVLLMLGATCVPALKMSVAEAMIYGTIYTLLVTRANPEKLTKEFFNGMGKGYGEILGIIIAAGVFAAGLTATGLVQSFVDLLKESNDIARWGGSFGPWCLGVITGSGDASTFAFNEAVTPHAQHFGMEVPNLGALAFLAGVLGRTASPISGAMVVVSGIAMVNPLEVSKRTFVPSLIALIALALTIV